MPTLQETLAAALAIVSDFDTLFEPSAIDTPYPEHAKNYMDEGATLPLPVYAPETGARDPAGRPSGRNATSPSA